MPSTACAESDTPAQSVGDETLSEQLRATEMKVRHSADLEGVTRLDLALRALASGLHHGDADTASIIAVRLDGGDLEVLLDAPTNSIPDGFEDTGDSPRLAAAVTDR
ncbi:MAG: hypothetical protein R2710_31160 [Acidimicrobiales bacterium]